MKKLFATILALLMMPIVTASAQAEEAYGPLDSAHEYNQALPDYKALHAMAADKSKPLVWVITGDSITHGALHTLGWRSYPEHWMERIKWEMGRLDDIVIDSGVSGEFTGGLLKRFDWRVAQFKPAVAFVNLGVNDTFKMGKSKLDDYRKNLEKLVTEIRKLKAIPVLQVPSMVSPDNPISELLPEFCVVVRQVAIKEKVLLVDHEAHWLKYASDPEVMKSWMNDAVHPNGKGHMEMFKKMATDLGFYDPKSPTCRLGDDTIR